MALRKITIDNSVRYIPKSGQSKESDVKTRTKKSWFSSSEKLFKE